MQTEPGMFWDLVEENRRALCRYAFALTGSDEDAKDLVSDTVLAAHKSFSNLRDVNGFRKSLYTIAKRIHTRRHFRKKLFLPLEKALHLKEEIKSESSHDLDILLRALNTLPKQQREAVILFEISGLSLEEVRQIQGGTLSGVKSRVKRGREELAKILSDHSKIILPSVGGNMSDFTIPSAIL